MRKKNCNNCLGLIGDISKDPFVMKKYMYIGGGFSDSQLLYVLPFANGYSRKIGITDWIFERPLSSCVRNQTLMSSILDGYNVQIYRSEGGALRYFDLTIRICLSLIPAFFLAFRVTRKKLLNKDGWLAYQFKHAVWDTAQNVVPDGLIHISWSRRFVASLRVCVAIGRTLKLLRLFKIECAILGHTVYTDRAQLALFQNHGIDVIAHAAFNFYRFLHKDKDSSFRMPSVDEWSNLQKILTDRDVELFWKSRRVGLSSYSEAQAAAIVSSQSVNKIPENVVLLHVFRDSPFNYIDRDRIFSDYVEWIIATLDVLRASSEKWLIKLHPAAMRWGENQSVWLQAIGSMVFNNEWPKNIEVSADNYTNIDVFENASRVVTYHGTAHLEAASWGIKPVVISDVTLNSYDKQMVIKPLTKHDYKKYLLMPSTSNFFRLSDSQIDIARRLLFLRDEVLTFGKDVDGKHVYRSDSITLRESDFKNIETSMMNRADLFELLGVEMASGLTRSVAFKYFDSYRDISKNNSPKLA
jgi:hypothetical protein